ncbi:alpha-N-acetylglucosaminidase [Streptomyces johnsoniae]|uniref:Alpha-N-acetylglucosaminidase n=1 Tax=Streptomyces johnsoniae TaxID=3075532 RepID=A0ABU2SEG1_9ACTN|nr:alpha-N-acetylglucosaminidase [Streptomyces sp. DSM 41886]MDT0447354.1 alpha-N-acetylglucosaminidase [Streptomyces sp. DSM 41886]
MTSPGERQTRAARQLLGRLLGERAADFTAEVVQGAGGPDWFEVDAGPAGVALRGSSGVAVASALRWYLRTACRTQITWDAPRPALPPRLPHAGTEGPVTSPYRHRYHFNVCTFGYTTAFWDWARWERHIDWMALHGVTTPLAMTGAEAVWHRTLLAAGLDDAAARQFLGGPAYLPWNWLASAAGWQGPLPRGWIDGHAQLGLRILQRERSLGMRPVLQGFSGHVPAALAAERGARAATLPWWDFEVSVLDPRDPLFAEFGTALLTEQTRLLGTDHLYAADPFIETTPPVTDPAEVARVAAAVHGAMAAADERATWVLQGWPFAYRADYWTPERTAAFLDAIPDNRMLVLDLWAEHRPVWRQAGGYRGKPWVWCMLHSLGGRPGLYGKLAEVAGGAASARADARGGALAGVGASMEAFGGDPVLYELLADVAWRGGVGDVGAWLAHWAEVRYGRRTPELRRAWELLHAAVYAADGPGPPGSVVVCRPTLAGDLRPQAPPHLAAPASPDVPPELAEAWALLLGACRPADSAGPLGRDLCDVAAQVLTHLACARQLRAADAALARDADGFAAAADALLGTVADLDALLATRPEYRLADWLEAARGWAATPSEARLYEANARRVLTLWGHSRSELHDYAGRHWAGLVRSFHLPRWRRWCTHIAEAIRDGAPYRAEEFEASMIAWEERWVAGDVPEEPPGPRAGATTAGVAQELWSRHRGHFQ